MKLRIKGNSLRLRLIRPEVRQLCEGAVVEESADFGGGQVLTYRVQGDANRRPPRAEFRDGTICVSVPAEAVQAWASSDDEGIYAQAGALAIAIEKDFRCVSRSGGDEEPDAYHNPRRSTCA